MTQAATAFAEVAEGDALPRIVAPVDLSRFFKDLALAAGKYRWFLTERGHLRMRACGHTLCPLMLVGWHFSHETASKRELPDTKNLSSSCGYTDHRVGAAVVHLADDIRSSPYYSKTLRDRLLEICRPKSSAEALDLEERERKQETKQEE